MLFLFLINIFVRDLLAICPIGAIQGLYPEDCYTLSIAPLNWYLAEDQCITQRGHLASISDGFRNAFLQQQINKVFQNIDAVWLGGNTIMVTNQWTWSDNSSFNYKNWAKGQPSSNSSSCMSINPSSGTWYSQSCSDSFPYICKINSTASISTCTTPSSIPASTLKPSNPCTEDYTYFNVTNKCYKLYKQALSFDSAEAVCIKDGGHLTSVHSDDETWYITVFGYGSPFWIGMHYEDSAWRWTDSTSVDYMHWGRTTPAGGLLSCVFIDMGYVDSTGFDWFGYWDNYYPCSQQWWAICKKDPL